MSGGYRRRSEVPFDGTDGTDAEEAAKLADSGSTGEVVCLAMKCSRALSAHP